MSFNLVLSPPAQAQYNQLPPETQRQQYEAILKMIQFRARQEDFLGGFLLAHYHHRLPITVVRLVETEPGIGGIQYRFAITLTGERIQWIYVVPGNI